MAERIEQLLQPAYRDGLERHPIDKLREMRAECSAYENAVSYYRRLAQARIEILEAERGRRDRGGSVEELVADLPRILSADSPGRSAAAETRLTQPDAPALELTWPDGREQLVSDSTLANLPALDDHALDSSLDDLRRFERELSDLRRGLHAVIDGLEREIANRQVAGATG
jgi:hypothetical protein